MNNFIEVEEVLTRRHESLIVLESAESVLVNRIKVMRDGKPKYAASERLTELRAAIRMLKDIYN
jgi:hypothetical protein